MDASTRTERGGGGVVSGVVRLLGRAAVLVAVAVALGAAANAVSPRGIAWYEAWSQRVDRLAEAAGLGVVSLEQTRAIVEAGEYLVLDARSEEQFAAGHLPGAMPLPRERIDEAYEGLQLLLTADQPVLVYCGGSACDDSIAVGEYLMRRGVEMVVIFPGGFEAWRAAGYPIEAGL